MTIRNILVSCVRIHRAYADDLTVKCASMRSRNLPKLQNLPGNVEGLLTFEGHEKPQHKPFIFSWLVEYLLPIKNKFKITHKNHHNFQYSMIE